MGAQVAREKTPCAPGRREGDNGGVYRASAGGRRRSVWCASKGRAMGINDQGITPTDLLYAFDLFDKLILFFLGLLALGDVLGNMDSCDNPAIFIEYSIYI